MQLRNLFFITLAACSTVVTQAQPLAVLPAANVSSYLGVGTQDVNADRAKALNLPEEAGVEVTLVNPNSPAAAGGIKTGDVIMQYNGERVEGGEQFARLVRETPVGRDVRLQIYRSGAAQTITVKIGARPAQVIQGAVGIPGALTPALPLSSPMALNRTTWSTPGIGVEVESLSGQLAEFFGVKDGVLVRSVTTGSAAEKAGLKAGDVITRVGDARVATPADLMTRLRVGRGLTTAITVIRDHKEQNLNLGLDTPRAAEPF